MLYATIVIFLSKSNNKDDIISDSDSKILLKLVKLNERYCKGKSGILFVQCCRPMNYYENCLWYIKHQTNFRHIHRVSIKNKQNYFYITTVWVKKSPLGDLTIFHFFHKRLRICKLYFTHLLNVPIFARLQIFFQLSPILTKLCHIKHNYTVHIICAKCPKRTKTRAFRRLRKSLIALLIVVCGKSL